MNYILREKLKTWVELVQTQQLDEVISEIQKENFHPFDETNNRYLCKLVLHLSHVAPKCDTFNQKTGLKLFKLTELVRQRIVAITDERNHSLALYHIFHCLLKTGLYKEARTVCYYLKQDDQLVDTKLSENIVHQWRQATQILSEKVLADPHNNVLYREFVDTVYMELDVIMLVIRNPTKLVVYTLRKHLEKIVPTSVLFQEFSELILLYINDDWVKFNNTDASDIYGNLCLILTRVLCGNFHDDRIRSTRMNLNKPLNVFTRIMAADPECKSCLEDFTSMYEILYQRVDNLTSETSKCLQSYTKSHSTLLRKCGGQNFMEWNGLCLILFIESLCDYWEICFNRNEKTFLNHGILANTMRLVDSMNNFYLTKKVAKCTACSSSNCKSKHDYYNEVIIKAKCLRLLNKLEMNDLSEELCELGKKSLLDSVSHLEEMKNLNCSGWKSLWKICGSLMYNLAVFSQQLYESCCDLYLLLCTSIVSLEGIDLDNSYLGMKDPLCLSLHRLGTLHYHKEEYRKSMTYVALNGLLGLKKSDCKAFRTWTSIKNKCSIELTMNECLKLDRDLIEEILNIDVRAIEFNPVELCLREAQGYRDSKTFLVQPFTKIYKELEQFQAQVTDFAFLLDYFGSHSLNFISNDNKLMQKILGELKRKERTLGSRWKGYLNFYTFVEELKLTTETIKAEMCMAKLDLNTPNQNDNHNDLVPAYSLINAKEHSRLMSILNKALTEWEKYLEAEISERDDPRPLLETIITAGEYARLHSCEESEALAWTLAYKLAVRLKDVRNMIYVTARSVSLRRMNMAWIRSAMNDAISIPNDKEVRILKLSLADYYYECCQNAQGRELLDSVLHDEAVSFLSNYVVHLHSLDTILRNYHAFEYNHEEYTRYIVQCLYALLDVEDDVNSEQWKPIRERLYGYDVLFTTTVNLSLRVNSIFSFREISAHLILRLKLAQCLGSMPRVAQILKCLCQLDLLRGQLDDCEVKLQGLEHILNIENFDVSMRRISTNNQNQLEIPAHNEPFRDQCFQKDTSPVLKKKLYSTPKFVSHSKDCKCYSCVNLLHLVFVCTFIRAQLCVLQNDVENALQHFLGAFKMKEKLFKPGRVEKMSKILKNDEDFVQVFPWKDRYYSVDHVSLLLDYGSLLKKIDTNCESIDLFIRAKIVCETYQIRSHPIYVSVQEYIRNERFIKLVGDYDYAKFTVPDPEDVSNYFLDRTNVVCTTPMINLKTAGTSVRSMRRNKTPTVITFNDIPVITLSDDEPEEPEPRRLRSQTLKRQMFH